MTRLQTFLIDAPEPFRPYRRFKATARVPQAVRTDRCHLGSSANDLRCELSPLKHGPPTSKAARQPGQLLNFDHKPAGKEKSARFEDSNSDNSEWVQFEAARSEVSDFGCQGRRNS